MAGLVRKLGHAQESDWLLLLESQPLLLRRESEMNTASSELCLIGC